MDSGNTEPVGDTAKHLEPLNYRRVGAHSNLDGRRASFSFYSRALGTVSNYQQEIGKASFDLIGLPPEQFQKRSSISKHFNKLKLKSYEEDIRNDPEFTLLDELNFRERFVFEMMYNLEFKTKWKHFSSKGFKNPKAKKRKPLFDRFGKSISYRIPKANTPESFALIEKFPATELREFGDHIERSPESPFYGDYKI